MRFDIIFLAARIVLDTGGALFKIFRWLFVFMVVTTLVITLIPAANIFGGIAQCACFGMIFIYLFDVLTYIYREDNNKLIKRFYIDSEKIIKLNDKVKAVLLPILKIVFCDLSMYYLSLLFLWRFGYNFTAYMSIAIGIIIIGYGLYFDIFNRNFNLRVFQSLKGNKLYLTRKLLIAAYLTLYIMGAAYITPNLLR